MPSIRVADRTMSYLEAGTGRPLVLLHAFPLSAEMWRPQLESFADRHRVIAPDLPGFAGSEPLQEASIDGYADAVAGLLDALGVTEPVVLGGCSMGGYTAFAFARRHAHRLAGLLLIDTKPEPDDDAAKANRDKLLAAADTLTPAKVVTDMLPKLLGDTTRKERPGVVAEVTRIGSMQPLGGVLAAVKALRDRPDAVPGLAAIRVPTLVLVGEEDAVIPPKVATAAADRIAGAKAVVLPAAGHLPNLETPAAFDAAVRGFLGG